MQPSYSSSTVYVLYFLFFEIYQGEPFLFLLEDFQPGDLDIVGELLCRSALANVVLEHIVPHISSVDLLRMELTCKAWHTQVRGTKTVSDAHALKDDLLCYGHGRRRQEARPRQSSRRVQEEAPHLLP